MLFTCSVAKSGETNTTFLQIAENYLFQEQTILLLFIYTSLYKLVPLFRKSSQRSSKEKPTPLEYTSQHKSTVVFFVKQKLPDHCLVIPNISKQYIVNSLLCISRSIFLYSILIKFMFDVCWQMTTRQVQFWKSRRGVKFTLMVDAASAGL